MKSRKQKPLPMWAVFTASAALLIFSYNISASGYVPEKIAYVSSVLAMPEAAADKAADLKTKIINFIEKSAENGIIQKFGTMNDILKNDFDSADLTATPADITDSMERVAKDFGEGKYVTDGEVVEETFTDNQATDSYGNIHVRNVTASQDIDIESIVEKGLTLPAADASEPTVLIYHTHSTETYIMTDNGRFSTEYITRSEDKDINMVRVGDEITRILKSRGIGVIHDREIYDTTYTGAYSKSREGIEAYLEEYPSIIITLDIHRDAVYYDDLTRMKPVAEIVGKKAAQMMIIAGAEGGSVTDFPSWETNLSFAVMLQKTANDKYGNLMKPIYFCNRKYNMDITPYSLLIEVGTDVNTLDEAAYSGRLLGDVLGDLINESAGEK